VILTLLVGALIAASPPAARGACLDSAKVVPMNMQPDNSVSSDVVQIDTLRWNADGRSEIILGFVYQLKRGDWWFGTRKAANMTPPGIKKLRRWLGLVVAKPEALRVLPIEWPDSSIAQYQLRNNWRRTLQSQRLSTSSCVAWPKNEPLPAQPT
jgi:hypothetical protein